MNRLNKPHTVYENYFKGITDLNVKYKTTKQIKISENLHNISLGKESLHMTPKA